MSISVASPASLRALAPSLRGLVRAVLALEGARPGEIGIVLAGDGELRELNRRWRGRDRATDVLSFPYGERARVSGDLVVSLDRVREQSRRYRVTPGAELARLIVHGTLHLAGHDHRRAAERRRMRRREERALRGTRTLARALDRGLRRRSG
jgi:probable rRNA maturation factor